MKIDMAKRGLTENNMGRKKYSAGYYFLNISTFRHHHKIIRTRVIMINIIKEKFDIQKCVLYHNQNSI